MKNKINYSSLTIFLLSVAVVVMSVGFATFSDSLEINGTTQIKGASWNVAFDEASYVLSDGSVDVNADGLDIGTLSMSYNVTLNKPGDYYEFTINIKNSGTFNAVLTGITVDSLSEAQSKYLTYEVTYDQSKYTTSASNLSVNLNSNASVPVKVRVAYVQPASASDLPSTAQELDLNVSFDYSQAA